MNEANSRQLRPSKLILYNITLIIMICLMCGGLIVAAEYFVRWYYRDVLSTADGKAFFTQRYLHRFVENNNPYGLRGKPVPISHDGRYRIIVQGDSLTWGQGVYPIDKRFTEIVEKKLLEDEFPKGVVVFNAGASGHNLVNHISYVRFVGNLHPDFVLYQWYVNDMDNKPDYSNVKTPPLVSNKKIHTYLWQHSALYYLLQQRYGIIRNLMGKQISYQEYLVNRFENPQSEHSTLADSQIGQLFEAYTSRGIDFGIVLFPSFSLDLNDYRLDFLHDRVLDHCEKHGINCLDLRSIYQGNTDNMSLWANAFDAHPGDLAHSMAAEAIYEHFRPYWIEQAQLRADALLMKSTVNTEQ